MARNLKMYPTGEDIVRAFARTLVGDDVEFRSLSPAKLQSFYTAWRKYWQLAGLNDHDFIHTVYERSTAEKISLATQFLHGQLQATYGRRFFATLKGYMGLSQSGIRIGHTVAILYGGKTPFRLHRNY